MLTVAPLLSPRHGGAGRHQALPGGQRQPGCPGRRAVIADQLRVLLASPRTRPARSRWQRALRFSLFTCLQMELLEEASSESQREIVKRIQKSRQAYQVPRPARAGRLE